MVGQGTDGISWLEGLHLHFKHPSADLQRLTNGLGDSALKPLGDNLTADCFLDFYWRNGSLMRGFTGIGFCY